jgi:hypothetical protein
MTKTREVMPPVGEEANTARTVNKHLLQLADVACAKAERSRQRWHLARHSKPLEVSARLRRRMLKHQAIAYHLDTVFRGRYEPGQHSS